MIETGSYVSSFLNEVRNICDRVSKDEVARVIDALFAAWERRAAIFIFGNGGSASTATHFAADLTKCTIVPGAARLRAFSLTDNIPLVSALTNDDGWENVYVEQLMTLFRPGDVALALSVHGGAGRDKAGAWSQNLMRGLQYAKDHGGVTLGFSGFDGGPMKNLADHCVVVPADSTPLVEGFHVVLHHLVTFALAGRIRTASGAR